MAEPSPRQIKAAAAVLAPYLSKRECLEQVAADALKAAHAAGEAERRERAEREHAEAEVRRKAKLAKDIEALKAQMNEEAKR